MDAELGHRQRVACPPSTQVMKIVLSPRASGDLERLRAFLTGHSDAATQRAVATLRERIALLADFPGLGKPFGRTNLRELYVPFGNSAYVIRYYVSQRRGEIVILRIWHGRVVRA